MNGAVAVDAAGAGPDCARRYGPVALVTGASSGIGAAFAQRLAARGLDLVLVARRRDRLEALASQLAAVHGVGVTVLQADLAATDGPQQVAEATAALDIGLVVSNAGFSLKGDHAGNDPAALTELLMVNCHAPLQLTRAFIPRLRARGRGGIILTSSVEGLIGCPYSGAYSATKALVKALGEALWAELRNDGIDVLTLCPGATATEGAARGGYDPSTVQHMDQPDAVAEQALAGLADGPILISSDHYRRLFEQLTTMPRRDALAAMAKGMRTSRGA
ncbi:SDR family NAD(P)-dependent oxidoreductase [Novosphingobium piscinae]|uniref:SDR family NAD(P)-dependent oxidoreductase n=1 Tax=Novosphingobium piscinae TaxID=1507448 RepID=A0A7X1FYY7_9SPHN|nr:SDR family NAD(P)-dependent oxidoreductase [Novosphingobium piscinae]MBC2669548.1 SDR family NAD(P)-dependent oxidoreductase [Novosphingobium piscinae]